MDSAGAVHPCRPRAYRRNMTVVTWDSFRAAEHFTMRNARLLDRHRFDFLFQAGSAENVRAALAAYRNIDGGYGNGLDPDLRGHASQPVAVELALRLLDELGPLSQPLATGDRKSPRL